LWRALGACRHLPVLFEPGLKDLARVP
jgi:hypothetical protein